VLILIAQVLALGLVASLAYVAAGLWKIGPDWKLGALLLAIGLYGFTMLALYRRRILEA